MEACLLSFLAIAISEIGDKTQLIALCLVTRFRKPLPVLIGIFAATLISNLLATGLGSYIGVLLQGNILHLVLGISFLGTAVWALIPEKEETCPEPAHNHNIFLASFVSFLLAEMGDKTQLATVALAARFDSIVAVVIGTTLGMMAANIPAVLLGQQIMARISLKTMRIVSGLVFTLLGLYELGKLL